MPRKTSKERNAARNRAKALLNKVPDQQTFLWNLITFQVPETEGPHLNERTVAIIGASYVEYGLRLVITKELPKDERDPKLEYLFADETGILRSFSAKIRMAKALGILKHDFIYDDLERIRHIRNIFAHSMETVTFYDPVISEICSEFTVAGAYDPENDGEGSFFIKMRYLALNAPMYRYARAADLFHSWFLQKATGNAPGVFDDGEEALKAE